MFCVTICKVLIGCLYLDPISGQGALTRRLEWTFWCFRVPGNWNHECTGQVEDTTCEASSVRWENVTSNNVSLDFSLLCVFFLPSAFWGGWYVTMDDNAQNIWELAILTCTQTQSRNPKYLTRELVPENNLKLELEIIDSNRT